MSKIFAQDIDLNKNEAHNFRLGNDITFPTLTPSDPGFIFYHSANKKFYGWDGTDFIDLGAGGGGAPVDLSNYVTLSTVQTISGIKTFSDRMSTTSFNMLPNGGGVLSGRHALYINNSNQLAWLGLSSTKGVYLDQSLITSGNPIVKFQATGGTIAHLTDVPANYEAVFTATVIDTGGGATYTTSTNNCYYTVIGNTCTLKIRIDGISTTGVASGQLKIGGIPLEARPSGVAGSFATASINISGSGIQHTVAHLKLNSDGTGNVLRRQTDSSSQNMTFTAPASWINGKIDVLMTYPLLT